MMVIASYLPLKRSIDRPTRLGVAYVLDTMYLDAVLAYARLRLELGDRRLHLHHGLNEE